MIRIVKLLPQVESNHRPHKLIRPAAIVGNNAQGIIPPMLCALTNWAMRQCKKPARLLTRACSIFYSMYMFRFESHCHIPSSTYRAHVPTGLLWNGLGSTPRPTSHDAYAPTRSDYSLRPVWILHGGLSSVASRPAMYWLQAFALCRFWVPSIAG